MNNKFDFTPKPWVTKYGINVYSQEKDRSICSCGINSSQKGIYEETEANARLIATAPEMIEALIESTKIMIDTNDWCLSDLIKSNVKLIEKATGKKWSEING